MTEDETGYTFRYDADYLRLPDAEAVSFTLPLTEQVYRDKVLFPFFDGLIPEGWLLDIAEKSCCKDCIGAVSVIPIESKEE